MPLLAQVEHLDGGGALAGGHYFSDGTLGDPIEPPDGLDYDLWLNGARYEPCRPDMVQRRWRSWWNYGGGQIADWVVHLTDVLFYAFPELQSPAHVCSRSPSRDVTWFHADRVLSTLTYPVSGDRFANTTCNFYFYDTHMKPDRPQLGIGEGEFHRFQLQVNGFGAIDRQAVQLGSMAEDAQGDECGQALPVGGNFMQGQAMIVEADGIDPNRPVGGQIGRC